MRNEVIKVESQAEVLKAKAFFNARYGDKIKDNFDDWGGFTHVGLINGVFGYYTLSDILETVAKVRVFNRMPLKVGDYVEVTGDGGHNTSHIWNSLSKDGIRKGEKHLIQVVDYTDDGFGDYTVLINDCSYRADYLKVIDNVSISLSKFKKINRYQAQEIIDIACPGWKERLFSIWGKKIVMKEDIEISESEYKDMRNACTVSQHVVFDRIFGKDESIKFGINDWILHPHGGIVNITDFDGKVYTFKGGNGHSGQHFNLNSTVYANARFATQEEILTTMKNTYPIGTYVYFLEYQAKKIDAVTKAWCGIKILQVKGYYSNRDKDKESYNGGLEFDHETKPYGMSNAFVCFRLATPSEIESVIPKIPKGKACLVRDFDDTSWKLYYADGNGKFFTNGNKTSNNEILVNWKQVIRLDEADLSNLPE